MYDSAIRQSHRNLPPGRFPLHRDDSSHCESNLSERQTRHVPFNDEAINLLSRWREQSAGDERVFAISTGFKTAWGNLLKRAKITRFRWHDLRHHFASRLVQRGVPLNTVRDLVGHSSVAMSRRYAHRARSAV
jgi:integrase